MKKCEIYDSLFTTNSLDDIINITEKYLNNPIFILDTSYHIITRSDLAKTVNSSIETHNGENYLLLNTIELMINEKCIDTIYNKDNSFFHYSAQSLIFCSIRVTDITVAYICILQNSREFEEEDLEISNVLSKVASMHMQKENFFISSSGLDEEYYLMDLLINRINDIQYVKERLKYINFNLNENCLMVSIPFKQKYKDSRQNFGIKDIMKMLKNILGNCISTYYKDRIVFLVSNEHEQVITAHVKKNLLEFLKLNNLNCGISIVFENLLEIQDFFYQSMYAIRLSKNSEMDHIAYFEDYMESYLFYTSECKNNDLHKINLLTLVHPWIVKLIKFDKENKTEFFKTLKAYIENNRNANITSTKLNIHRSTLFYRFNKMQDFLGISLDSSNNLFNLELSFKILNYNAIIKN
jgi:sugar diacid utilization regulator